MAGFLDEVRYQGSAEEDQILLQNGRDEVCWLSLSDYEQGYHQLMDVKLTKK